MVKVGMAAYDHNHSKTCKPKCTNWILLDLHLNGILDLKFGGLSGERIGRRLIEFINLKRTVQIALFSRKDLHPAIDKDNYLI